MKRSFFFPLFFLLLMAVSCQNDEDTIPTVILGTWEMVDYNDHLELDAVTAYQFNDDGTFTHSSTLRERGSDVDLGYSFLQTGTFRTHKGVIMVTLDETLLQPYYGEKLYYTREELERTPLESNEEYPFNYELRNDGSILFIPGGIVGGDGIVADRSFEKKN